MHQLGFKLHLPLVLAPDERDEHEEEEEEAGGSKGTWYRARKVALKRYADETYNEVGCECYVLKSRRKLCMFAHSSPEKKHCFVWLTLACVVLAADLHTRSAACVRRTA